MRTPEPHVAKDGTVTYKIKFREHGTYTSETFHLERDAITFAGQLDGGGVTAARAWLAARQGRAQSNALTFGGWFETYLTELTGVTPRTRDDYRSMHRLHLAHLDHVPLDQVTRSHVAGIVNSMERQGRVWIPACDRAGLSPRPSPHDCRDTHASWLISDGASLEAVQDQLGHNSILTTRERYADLLPAVGVEVGRLASAAMERALAHQPKEIEA